MASSVKSKVQIYVPIDLSMAKSYGELTETTMSCFFCPRLRSIEHIISTCFVKPAWYKLRLASAVTIIIQEARLIKFSCTVDS